MPFLDPLTKTSIQFYNPAGSTYQEIYGTRYPSFQGYDYLDIYFQFTDDSISPGANVKMEAWSTSGKIESINVLAYALNGAVVENAKTYHVQIPISGWRDVTLISFTAIPSTVHFEIKGVHLGKAGDDPVCAGNVWLESLDAEDPSVDTKMCEALGLAWLGNAAPDPSLRCCGNTAGEYGVGDGKGCWNSLSIQETGKTVNTVQVELTYGKSSWSYADAPQDVSATLTQTRQQRNDDGGVTEEPSTSPYYGSISGSSPQKIGEVVFIKSGFVSATLSEIYGGKAYLFDPIHPEDVDEEMVTVTYDDLEAEKTKYYVMATADTLTQTYLYDPSVTEIVTYSCSSSTCTFPLKGVPPYTIKNLYPQKYDLFFVAKDHDGQESRTFIPSSKTVYAPDGWLEVQNLPSQVLFTGKEFLGCGDIAFLGDVPLMAKEMCFAQKLDSTITSGFYCDIWNGWQSDSLKATTYDAENNIQFLPDVFQKPEDRNHTSSIVFGRNILVNPMLDLTK
ncbi:hypothetical protein HY496_03160 [Candidatus Woesearchaeota archaeon]|nr:hypothetical protein [Candidatus Woesearchaeota archaeon]